MKPTALVLAAALVAGCPSQHHVAPTTLADGGDMPSAVCGHLAAIGCSAGTDPSCRVVVGKIAEDSIIHFDATCLLAATDADSVRACGGVRCR
jgi:hypothetical protein